ncbi:A-kinase-interacting protein 1 isoform X2 [Lampris incognitus]|uniref:A-kinase-interacting protein 1 isoform X2 n=1 Tax=Lampris incognitus TaxID=2546036 RepID=UPI0024B5DB07|nr:A-kinase-interacting protein 1 isoform X2 [Lampris incognitus]
MASQNWLDSSLRRSALLGQEVLRRASRRSVDWTSTTSTSQTPTSNQDDRNTLKRTHTNLHDAFGTIAEFMAQTTHQCKNFYDSEHCETSNIERNHVSRFHTQPTTGTTMSALSTRKHGCMSVGEDFHIEVSPGTYAITAGTPDSGQQTELVNIKAGESVNLTFNF